jgi:hypothetical protein
MILDDQMKSAMDAGIKFGMEMLKQIPRDDLEAFEEHLTGVLIVFWSALWGTFGTEYARGFIEAQLSGMEPGVPHERYTEPPVQ